MLTGKKILLRAPEPGDVDMLYAWENDVNTWLVSGTTSPFARHTLQQFLDAAHHDIYTSKQLRLMIALPGEEHRVVGCIDLFDFDPKNRRAGLGILIGALRDRKKGYALEAVEVLAGYAFSVLDLHQLYCNVMESNQASLSLFQKLGFEVAGYKKEWVLNNGEWENEYILQRIRGK